MACAGPYANNQHLAPDRQPHQHPIAHFVQAGCPSCRPTNSVKALKDDDHYWRKYLILQKKFRNHKAHKANWQRWYSKTFCNNLLGIFVHPVAGDEVTFKQMRPPLFHLGFALTTQSTLLFLQQIFLIRCCCLIPAYDGVTHRQPQSETTVNQNHSTVIPTRSSIIHNFAEYWSIDTYIYTSQVTTTVEH